jgi:hypothetical protein
MMPEEKRPSVAPVQLPVTEPAHIGLLPTEQTTEQTGKIKTRAANPDEKRKPSRLMAILDTLTDKVAMFLAIGVEVFTVILMFVTVTPDPWSKIVMGTLGAAIVLFSVRALAKRKRGLWWLIAIVIVFSDISLLLSLTDSQIHQVSAQDDPALKRLQKATDDAQAAVDRAFEKGE